MNCRSRALLITPVMPDAAGGGAAQRAHQWLYRLAREHDVDVLVVHRRETLTPARALAAASRLGAVRELNPTPTRARYWWNALRAAAGAVTGRRAFAFVGWGREWAFLTSETKAKLEAEYGERRWDRLVAFRLQVFDYAAHFLRAGQASRERITIDFDDLESLTRRSIANGLQRARRRREAWLTWIDARYAARVEKAVVREIPHVAVAAPEDRSWIEASWPGVRVEMRPNRIAGLPVELPPGDLRRILFLGTLAYFPNQEAVRFLAGEVLPALRNDDPRWTLVVAGMGLPVGLRRWLERRPGVEVRGAVEDVGEAYRATGVVAAPIFCGGGTKLKVIEALAYGRPVVAASHAVRGLALRPTQDFWPAEDASEWIAGLRRLAAEPALARHLGASGRAAVREAYVYGATFS